MGSKGAAGKGVLTIASFADMTIPTLTQRPATGTIIPGSTILNGVEGTLGVGCWMRLRYGAEKSSEVLTDQ